MFGIEFAFGSLATFSDEVVACFAAEQGDGLNIRCIAESAVEAGSFAVVQRSIFVELPEYFLRAIVGRAADLLDELLGAFVADGTGVAIHPGLAAEFFAEVFDWQFALAVFYEKRGAGGIELVEGTEQIVLAIEGDDPAAAEVDLSLGETVFTVFGVSRDVAGIGRAVVLVEPAEGRLGREIGVVDVVEGVWKFTVIPVDSHLANLIRAFTDHFFQKSGESGSFVWDDRGGRVLRVEIGDLVENDISEQGFGADRGRIEKRFFPEIVRVLAEDLTLAGGGADFGFDTEHHRDVLVGMEAVRDEKRNDHNVLGFRHFIPFGDEGFFLHVCVGDQFVSGSGCGDEIRLVFDRLGGVLVQAGAVTGDNEGGIGRVRAIGDFSGPAENEIGH